MLDVVVLIKKSIGIEVPLEIFHLDPYPIIPRSLKHSDDSILEPLSVPLLSRFRIPKLIIPNVFMFIAYVGPILIAVICITLIALVLILLVLTCVLAVYVSLM